MMINRAYASGRRAAMMKFALGPPTQVDQFMADVEQGKDVPPEPALPPMSNAPGGVPPALDGSIPMEFPMAGEGSLGSTVSPPPPAPPMAGDPSQQPPPSMGALQG